MKRYLVFGGDRYYPIGGWDDFDGSYESVEEALEHMGKHYDWWHIVDSTDGQIIKSGENTR